LNVTQRVVFEMLTSEEAKSGGIRAQRASPYEIALDGVITNWRAR